MTAVQEDNVGSGWRKLFALLPVVLAIGLPINNISDCVLLVILAVVICCGEVSARPRAWAAAAAIVVAGVLAQALLSPPRIEEGHNVFLPSPALERLATNMVAWLTGPSALAWHPYAPLVVALIALHAVALAIVIYVTVRGRTFDPWLRLIG
ncbi:MAG TPA: hypothetical protein VIY07_08120, partial [Pseudolabrys sp.]